MRFIRCIDITKGEAFSTKSDRVFVHHEGHGDVGIFFVNKEQMTVKQLNWALRSANKKGLFKELTYYVVTCHRFEDIRPAILDIWYNFGLRAFEESAIKVTATPHRKYRVIILEMYRVAQKHSRIVDTGDAIRSKTVYLSCIHKQKEKSVVPYLNFTSINKLSN